MDEEMKTTIKNLIKAYEELIDHVDVRDESDSEDKECWCWKCIRSRIEYIENLREKVDAYLDI